MLSAITWLYLYPLTANSRSPGGKSHLKRSVDQKVVLQLHIVKPIILGSKYWGLHAHLSQSVFIYWAHLCKMSIYPYENSFVSVASCSSSQQYFCAQISHPQIKLSSVWKAHEANKQAADRCWLPHPWQGTATSPKYQIITSDLMPACRGGGAVARFFFLKGCNYCIRSCSNHNSPSHTILDHVHLPPVPLFLGTLLWWGLFYFSKPPDKHLPCFCPPVWLVLLCLFWNK